MTLAYPDSMGRMFGLVAFIVVIAVGGYVYLSQMQTLTPQGSSPNSTITVTGVRNDLISIANAERHFFASNGRYATLDELRLSNETVAANRMGYLYSASISATDFQIIATYSGTSPNTPKRISVNGAMEIKID